MNIAFADRLQRLPPYLFARLEELTSKKRAEGIDIIDFGIGDPDLPTPEPIIKVLQEAVTLQENHTYSSSSGELYMRQAVADFYKKRFDVDLDPDKEVCITLGSKEALANVCKAFVNAGEKVISPDPAYPVYANGAAVLSDAVPVKVPLLAEEGFLLDVERCPNDAKMLFLNYPNNPTGATCDVDYLRGVIEWCNDNEVIFCYDNAYSEMCFDGYLAPSALEAGRELIEFGSLSKTFNMTGYRIGYAVGDERLIAGLKKCKSQIDSGAPKFIQKAAAYALGMYEGRRLPKVISDNMAIYGKRRNVLVRGLRELGFDVPMPKATFYVWFDCGMDSMKFTEKMLQKGIVFTPGVGFGEAGEGFVRVALTRPLERIEEALHRMSE
ncbi:MAG TPA: aminotransferase class I/II-fold pyridoxal phosphate-dependent enzyme [Candidatus Methanomethylophilaceae archaeon]|nr:aminotransferase class I/II-fold pyridoxal phosphate-dependent enzyme [Candidatus Methanomethylophilaceae archaeon]